jgi:site-specific DNA recombinase
MRAAIYARFSTELQDQKSIADQVRICREHAQRRGHSVVAVYEDAAASGASVKGRPGIQRLMQDANKGIFDVVLTESMSRIGRDTEDRANIRKHLAFCRISIETPADGVVTPLVDGIRAVIDSQHLEDLKHHTRRGMRGVVLDGRSAGGRAYGYDVVPGEPDGRGSLRRGFRVINEKEAEVVRRIYTEYVAGSTPREIAKRLNDDRIPPPRGKSWNASTINGNTLRSNGILLNQMYVGRIIWNKVTMVKNPATGRRVIRPNPKEAWVMQEVPALAIVSAELFEAARRRKAERSKGHPQGKRRPKHLLSGLLRCSSCGGGLSTFGKDRTGRRRVRCSTHTESGSCPNTQTYYVDAIERAVLSGLRAELSSPALLTEYVKAYHEERAKLAAGSVQRRAAAERRLGEIERETERLVDAIAKGFGDPSILGGRINELKSERIQLADEIAAMPNTQKVITLHPGLLARYEQQVEQLQAALAAGLEAGDEDGAAALRELIEAVKVERNASRPGGLKVTIVGRLNALLGDEHFPNGVCGKGVAGAGIEPATYGL